MNGMLQASRYLSVMWHHYSVLLASCRYSGATYWSILPINQERRNYSSIREGPILANVMCARMIVRTLCERAIEVQHDLYLCFIDYAKAFDKVKHENLFEFLQNLDIDKKPLLGTIGSYKNRWKHWQIYTNTKRSSTRMCFLSRLIQPIQ